MKKLFYKIIIIITLIILPTIINAKVYNYKEKTTTNMIQKTSPIFAVKPLISKEI
jgi:hypothetical protein